MSTSTVPAVLSALAGVWSGVSTFVGEPVQAQYGDFVAVGWAGPDNDAVTATVSEQDAAMGSGQESYTVAIQCVAWSGSTDLLACITRAYGYYDVLFTALAANPHLAGSTSLLRIESHTLAPNQTESGALAIVTVSVDVTAFRAN